jgi:hypothetical protein
VNLVADAAERGKPGVIVALHGGGIVERPVQPLDGGRKYRTCLARGIADRNQKIGRPIEKLVDRFRPMPRNVDSDLRHCGDRFRTHMAGLRARRVDLERSPASCRSSPSAIWLRAELPVHRIRTRRFTAPLPS